MEEKAFKSTRFDEIKVQVDIQPQQSYLMLVWGGLKSPVGEISTMFTFKKEDHADQAMLFYEKLDGDEEVERLVDAIMKKVSDGLPGLIEEAEEADTMRIISEDLNRAMITGDSWR